MSETKAAKAEREEYAAKLREILKPGDTVYTVLHHAARSGMMRRISLHIVRDGEIRDITYWAAKAAGFSLDQDRHEIRMGGAGMDMGFAAVYYLSRSLFRDGFHCTGSTGTTPAGNRSSVSRCPSNDHTNDYGDHSRAWDADCEAVGGRRRTESNAPTYDRMRREFLDKASKRDYSRTRLHSDGGYALAQRWM